MEWHRCFERRDHRPMSLTRRRITSRRQDEASVGLVEWCEKVRQERRAEYRDIACQRMAERLEDCDRDICCADVADREIGNAKINLRLPLTGAALSDRHGLDSELVGE